MLTARLCGGTRSTRSPRMWISPELGATKPPITFRVVVLPQPEGPSRQKNSPSWMSRSTGSSAMALPYRLDTPRSAMATDWSLTPAASASAGAPHLQGHIDALLGLADVVGLERCDQHLGRFPSQLGRVVGDRGHRRIEVAPVVGVVETHQRHVGWNAHPEIPRGRERTQRQLGAGGHDRIRTDAVGKQRSNRGSGRFHRPRALQNLHRV